jgi:hypothetical protein
MRWSVRRAGTFTRSGLCRVVLCEKSQSGSTPGEQARGARRALDTTGAIWRLDRAIACR